MRESDTQETQPNKADREESDRKTQDFGSFCLLGITGILWYFILLPIFGLFWSFITLVGISLLLHTRYRWRQRPKHPPQTPPQDQA
jgi:hypothetical protein